MNKKFIYCLLIIISSSIWTDNAYAGTDIINNILLKVNNGIEKFSATYEKISSEIKDITRNKIMGSIASVQEDIERLKDRVDYEKKAYENVINSDYATNLRNLIERTEIENMEKRFNKIREDAIRVLESRGWIKNNSDKPKEEGTISRNTDEPADENDTIITDSPIKKELNTLSGSTIKKELDALMAINEKNNNSSTLKDNKQIQSIDSVQKNTDTNISVQNDTSSNFSTTTGDKLISPLKSDNLQPVSRRQSFISISATTVNTDNKANTKEKINAKIN